jgi:EAL domain-containing protein (putative c-di-GMP-specific phosphodiesterase class I)/GGDEF domain-containing protein
MKAQAPLTLPWSRPPLDLTEDVRWELSNQLTELARLSLWALLPVILLTVSGLWQDLSPSLLLGWGALALVQTGAGYCNNRLNRIRLDRHDSNDEFLQRNTLYYAFMGSVWGLLPLFAALWGSERAAWFTLLVLLAILTSLVLVLSTSHRIFHGVLLPSGLLLLASLWLGPVYSAQLFLLGSIYLVALAVMHNLLFLVQLDRVRNSLQHAAEASALANTLEHHDALTQLFNKSGLRLWIEQRTDTADYVTVNVALASVKGLSDINELYGSAMADALLRQLAEKLAHNAGDHIGIARLAGAEFLLVDIAPGADPEALVQLLASLEHEQFSLAGRRVNIALLLSCVQGPAQELENLMEAARSRLQAQHGNHHDHTLPRRRELVTSFHNALSEGGITPWFQPITDCASGHIIGWEALVRWEHPVLGILPPDAFLDIARICGQSSQLTRSMFSASARFLQQLMAQHCSHCAHVSINFTGSDLASAATIDWMRSTLAEYGLQPNQFTIEIPEKEALLQDARFTNNLIAMREAGVNLAIDDFGTGYANLGHLLDLPASTIKIDKRFVDKLPSDKQSIALVRAMLTMAQSMGMQAVAEGVERAEQLEFLRENGCDACQGYLGGNAMPLEAALAFVQAKLRPGP